MAGPPPHYVPKDITAKAGDVVFFLTNESHGTHTLAIGRVAGTPLATSGSVLIGDSAVYEVYGLHSGEYVIWCTIDNHAAEGMVGTLTIEP